MLGSATIRLTTAAARRCSTRLGRINHPIGRTATIRNFGRSAVVNADDDELPYHIVVGMPALSPTMETGTLTEWYVEEGGAFSAGESIAKIETDKASIDFEAQDDGYIAKILKEAGDEDIECGVPIMVTVEEEDECAAFKDFVVEEEETMVATPAAVVEPVASPPSPVVEAAAAVAPPPPPPAPVVAAAAVAVTEAPVATAETIAAALDPIMTTGWGEYAKLNSPILKTLSKNQSAYVELYGTTGMVPL